MTTDTSSRLGAGLGAAFGFVLGGMAGGAIAGYVAPKDTSIIGVTGAALGSVVGAYLGVPSEDPNYKISGAVNGLPVLRGFP
jgi:hypothetical protein